MSAQQILLGPIHIVVLILQLRIVLLCDLILAQIVHTLLLAILELLRLLVVLEQHAVCLLQLLLLFAQFLHNYTSFEDVSKIAHHKNSLYANNDYNK